METGWVLPPIIIMQLPYRYANLAGKPIGKYFVFPREKLLHGKIAIPAEPDQEQFIFNYLPGCNVTSPAYRNRFKITFTRQVRITTQGIPVDSVSLVFIIQNF
jgi:hypothetical protein